MRTWGIGLGALLLLLLLLYAYRTPILRGIGSYLIVEDEPGRVECIYVLGGNSYDRGKEAARIYQKGNVPEVVCTGGHVPSVFRPFDLEPSEAEVSARVAKEHGVPRGELEVLSKGKSTWEEAHLCLDHALKMGADTIAVLSDEFHLRRVRSVFAPLFEKEGVELRLWGASSSSYDELEWWRSEEGMIMVNNEYMKLLYYCFKTPPSTEK